MRRRRTVLAVGATAVAVAALGLTGCDTISSLARPATPVVLTGSQIAAFAGVAPDRVVAFKHEIVGEAAAWTQVPVQVDQRKVVPFGSQPGANTDPGTTGTVYGNGSGGPTALQYADAQTWVGADTDPNVDSNDEIVFMSFDAGGKPRAQDAATPAGVVAGSGVAVRVTDPRNTGEFGYVYLFRSTGGLDPSAGKDYVDYRFTLTSGDYKATYKRADGPNPETSTVTTSTYEIGMVDRWKESSWKVRSPGATGVDVLDGHKNQFAISTCARSNDTFADAEGAFVANIDGPVRAIRSYVGANSGPITQRTHLYYRDREVTITNLRVHAIGGVMDFLDLSAAASGMTLRTSTKPGGVPVDGVLDTMPSALAGWESYDGPQGNVLTRQTFTSDVSTLAAGTVQFSRDQLNPPEAQCWGDGSFYGASGSFVNVPIPNTDPRTVPASTVTGLRVTDFAAPAADKGAIAAASADWATDLDQPLTIAVTTYAP